MDNAVSNNTEVITPTNTITEPKPQPTIQELQQQLDAIKAGMAETLAAAKADAEKALAEAKLESASKITARVSPETTSGAMDAQIDKAIRRLGNAKWELLTPAQKAEVSGVHGSDENSEEIGKFFGKGSDSRAAQQLFVSNPARYRRLKNEAKLRGIF